MSLEVPSILELNDDCMWSIFSYLNLPELFVVEKVCERFAELVQRSYRMYRNLDFTSISKSFPTKSIPQRDVEFMAKTVGNSVHVLKLADQSICTEPQNWSILPNDIFSHLQNVQYIYLEDYHFDDSRTLQLDKLFPHLKYIQLDTCYLNEKLVGHWFTKTTKLEVLKLINMKEITGECFANVKGIKDFKLKNCLEIKPQFFQQFCELNPQLQSLSVHIEIGCSDDRSIFTSIWQNLKNLESLAIFESWGDDSVDTELNYDILRDLPKITQLCVQSQGEPNSRKLEIFLENMAIQNRIEYLNVNFLEASTLEKLRKFPHLKVLMVNKTKNRTLAKLPAVLTCVETLEELHLIGCTIKPDKMKELIMKFKSLRLINLCDCTNFNDTFLKIIEECLNRRSKVIDFIVNRTPIGKELQKEPKSAYIQEFIDRMEGKVKLTDNSYHLNGKPKKSFHKWDDWMGEEP